MPTCGVLATRTRTAPADADNTSRTGPARSRSPRQVRNQEKGEHMRLRWRSTTSSLLAAAVLAGASTAALAEAPQDRFWAGLEYFYPTISSTARVDANATTRPGSTHQPRGRARPRGSQGHAVPEPRHAPGRELAHRVRVLRTQSRGHGVIGRTIDFGDTTFPIGTQLTSRFDSTVYRLTGGWSFYKDAGRRGRPRLRLACHGLRDASVGRRHRRARRHGVPARGARRARAAADDRALRNVCRVAAIPGPRPCRLPVPQVQRLRRQPGELDGRRRLALPQERGLLASATATSTTSSKPTSRTSAARSSTRSRARRSSSTWVSDPRLAAPHARRRNPRAGRRSARALRPARSGRTLTR